MSASRTGTMLPTRRESMISQPSATLMPIDSFFDDAIEAPEHPVEAAMSLQTSHQSFSVPPSHTPEPNAVSPPYNNQATADENRRPARRAARKEAQSKATPAGDRNHSMSITEAPGPRKRGRKPKRPPPRGSETTSDQGEEPDDDDLPLDPRRRRILERNRIAATKCRLRKRDEASVLVSREHVMEDQNRHLSYCFDSLTAEIFHLKTQLLRHTNCGCILIHKYIAHEAEKSVNNMLGVSSGFNSDVVTPNYRGSSHLVSSDHMTTNSEAESVQGSWATLFKQASAMTIPQDEILGQGLKEHQEMLMTLDHPASMPLAMPRGHLGGYGSGSQARTADLQQAEEGTIWDPSWEAR